MTTAKHKFQQQAINAANQKVNDFQDEIQNLARDALGLAAQPIIQQFISAMVPSNLKNSINQAHLENGTYGEILSHLEKEELNGLEASDEHQLNSVTQNAIKPNHEKPIQTCHHKKTKPLEKSLASGGERKKQMEGTKNGAGKNNSGAKNINPDINNNNPNNRKPKTVYPPGETRKKKTHSTWNSYSGANEANRPPE